MGNVLCGIVPTDMVCSKEDQTIAEKEKILISLKHYNSHIIDKKIHNTQPGENDDADRHFPLSMPVPYTLVNNEPNQPYSLNEQKIYAN